MFIKRIYKLTLIFIVMALFIAACGGSQETIAPPQTVPTNTSAPGVESPPVPTNKENQPMEPTATEDMAAETQPSSTDETPPMMEGEVLPPVNPLDVSGDIITAGSSTVFPLAEAIANRFEDEGYSGQITIESIGSGAGFERFCVNGETDVSNASRPIRESEIESCRAIDREPIEFRVGTDALAVTVSQDNDFLSDLTFDQLALIFSTAETWSDVDPSWPNEAILRYIPGTDSGTFDYFVEEIFDEDEEPILNASNNNLSEDDNVLVQGIIGSPYAIGFFGYAYYAENEDQLKVMSIEGVTPSAASVDDGTYPLARPLFIYSDANIMQSKPQVADYINFFLTHVKEEIVDVGYFPASPVALDLAKIKWIQAMQ